MREETARADSDAVARDSGAVADDDCAGGDADLGEIGRAHV